MILTCHISGDRKLNVLPKSLSGYEPVLDVFPEPLNGYGIFLNALTKSLNGCETSVDEWANCLNVLPKSLNGYEIFFVNG